MLSSVLLILAASSTKLEPVGNVWVYAHASSPRDDTFLRFWGTGSSAVGDLGNSEFSWSMMEFDLSKLPGKVAPTTATLTLTCIGEPDWTEAESKVSPIEVRSLTALFDEDKWDFNDATKFAPDPTDSAVLGKAPGKPSSDHAPFTVVINLMENAKAFESAWKAAGLDPAHRLGLALTSKLSPQDGGQGHIYKVYSRYAGEGKRPVLELAFPERQ